MTCLIPIVLTSLNGKNIVVTIITLLIKDKINLYLNILEMVLLKSFNIIGRFGEYLGKVEEYKPFNFGSFAFILVALIAGFFTVLIWPTIYDLFLSKIEEGKTYEIITMSTTIGGVLLGCIFALVYTLYRCIKGGPKSMGMSSGMMLSASIAGIGGFILSFGATAVSFVILGIYTGTFNWGEFLVLLLLSALTSAFLCIIPTLITGLVTGIIVLVYNIVGGIISPAK